MPGGRPIAVFLLGLAAGCRSPAMRPPCPPPPPLSASAELPVVQATAVVPPGFAAVDPASAVVPAVPAEWRGLTEHQCRCLAAANSGLARLIEQEGQRAGVFVPTHRQTCPPDEGWKCEARRHAADEARNRSAADALDRYFQLADAVARSELLADGLKLFDELRAEVPAWRAAGLPSPTDDELIRRRAKLLSDAEQAEAGMRLLDIDLKVKLGLSTKSNDRLRPIGPFPSPDEPIDAEAAVRTALERRSDLRFPRTLYQNLSADSLPAARDALRASNPLLGDAGPPLPMLPFGGRVLRQAVGMAAETEIPVRRQQLFDLIVERERQAAAEVRAAASQLAPLARRAALATATAESWRAKVLASGKPAERRPAELEWITARADAVQAAFDWQRARAKFLAAQGRLPDGCE